MSYSSPHHLQVNGENFPIKLFCRFKGNLLIYGCESSVYACILGVECLDTQPFKICHPFTRTQTKQHGNTEETFGSAQKINMHVATLSDRIGTQCELLIPLSECRISIQTAIPSIDLCCLSDALVARERKCVCKERAQKCALVNFN